MGPFLERAGPQHAPPWRWTASPAARAGVHEGDLVVGLDGVTIDSVDRLHQTLDASRVHRDVVLKASAPVYLTVRASESAG